MEWVETTGATIDEARLRALDTLGVAYDDADIEIVAEPKKGMFGIGRSEARVRARVRPVEPRAKAERRDRGRRKGGGDRGGRSKGGDRSRNDRPKASGGQAKSDKTGGGDRKPKSDDSARDGGKAKGSGGSQRKPRTETRAEESKSANNDNERAAASTPSNGGNSGNREQTPMDNNEATEVMDAAGQAAVVEDFLDGLLEAFGASGDIESVALDEETYEVRVHGAELGLLIGPKGQTMQSVQDIARTAVQQEADGSLTGRVHIDIGGYRDKRRTALADFAVRVAETVRSTGEARVLEPMPATDRKVVHDAVADVDGVVSSSEGTENRRHIVLSPAD